MLDGLEMKKYVGVKNNLSFYILSGRLHNKISRNYWAMSQFVH